MEILDELEALDPDALNTADLDVVAYRLNESAQRPAVAMLERSGHQKPAVSR